MNHPLTGISQVNAGIESYLAQVGRIFRVFGDQDSGCISYGVQVEGVRWFVKHSDEPRGVASLRRARHLHTNVEHRALPRLHHTFGTPGGLALVYEWVPGELLYVSSRTAPGRRRDPGSAPMRFRALPVERILDALDTIYDVHLLLADRGFIAVDFYDGCIIYDFEGSRTHLCDLDEYRTGPFVLAADRLPGSRRFMAPEEFQTGARIDQVTNVFTLGRTAAVLLGDRTGSMKSWRGTGAMKRVVVRATAMERQRRHQSVQEFVAAWRSAVDRRAARAPGDG